MTAKRNRPRPPRQSHDETADKAPAGIYFVYDAAGHLLGEYNEHGKAQQETVWLGDVPVAVLSGEHPYYVYADHLNSPRAITDHTGKVVWRWDSDPFGAPVEHEEQDRDNHSAGGPKVDEDPDRDGQRFVYHLRFPGQYYDRETGLHYNLFRDYDPKIGRYIESDPIGLAGGLNTYAYVGGNPVNLVDPSGLAGEIPDPNGANIPGGPWEPRSGMNPGSFQGPKLPGGGRNLCEYVPPNNDAPNPYWKVNEPGIKGWQRYWPGGQPIPPEIAHPGNPNPAPNLPPPLTQAPPGVPTWVRVGGGAVMIFYSSPLY